MNKILEDLKARGLVAETFGPIEDNLKPGEFVYCGCDPTSDSLGVHHLLAFMTLKRLKEHGMKPIVLIGGATGSLGDPSFKEKERDIIPLDTVMHNCECIKNQLTKIIGDDVIFVNNYDWVSKFNLLDFMRDIGKKFTVNYMMAKESVKIRLNKEGSSLSLCEFIYSCLQGYDFVHLYEKYGCKVQIGGRDQTGNLDSGFVLGHKKKIDELSAFVWPLLVASDGKKFGKSEGNSIYLSEEKTSVYDFYQYFLNLPDVDTEDLIKKFTLLPLDEIDALIEEHHKAPEKRTLQKRLAEYMTVLVHSKEAYDKAVEASNILFGKSTVEQLKSLDDKTLLSVFKDVPSVNINLGTGMNLADIAIECKDLFTSKGDFKKLVNGGGVSLNKQKVTNANMLITETDLLNDKYLLMQKGKKYSLVVANR